MNNKTGLHPRNKHKTNYEFSELVKTYPKLKNFVAPNKFGTDSIDFSNPEAVMALNAALLKHFYSIEFWEVPKNYLCPPIPGRADYIHHMSDFFPRNELPIKILDIGVGANCVYPLIANKAYGWTVVGSDIDPKAIENAQMIVSVNNLDNEIELRLQKDKHKIFENIVQPGEKFLMCISNPPFHESIDEARAGSIKKNKNLGIKKDNSNFGGQNTELWCDGGELAFITQMIVESVKFKNNFVWFSSLVSKSTTLPYLYDELKNHGITKIKTIDMSQGQKKSRILAWGF